MADPCTRWDDHDTNRDSLWATEHETRDEIVDRYHRVWRHSGATIDALALDTSGQVPWWPQPEVKLFNVMVHLLNETNRHAGHADILREQLDGATGDKTTTPPHDESYWQHRRSRIEQAARSAESRG